MEQREQRTNSFELCRVATEEDEVKVARTIADLDTSSSASPSPDSPILHHHIAEAVGYRNLDRDDWAER